MQLSTIKLLLTLTAVVVCCEAAASKYPPHQTKFMRHRNWKLLPHNQCGETPILMQSKIVGGNHARVGQFPWMVGLLETERKTKKSTIYCGGALINDRYVVTAAHCIIGLPKLQYVVLGEHNQDTDIDCDRYRCSGPARKVRVQKTVCHPSYSSSYSNLGLNDICLIRLSTRIVKYDEFIRPICLPTYQMLEGRSFSGMKMETAGWGWAAPGHPYTKILRVVTVPVISEKECKRWVYDVVKSQICAKGDNGKDSCTGDSGGPLMGRVAKPNGIGYFSVLIGITSFGESKKTRVGHVLCGDHIGVYVRVSEYIQWILNNIRE